MTVADETTPISGQRRQQTIDTWLLLGGYSALIIAATGIGALCWALARRLWR